MQFVHLTKNQCDALKFLNKPKRTFRQLRKHLGLYHVSVRSLIRYLVEKDLVTVDETVMIWGFDDGKKLKLYTSNVTPEKASEMLGLSVLSDSMGGQVKSTYHWLRSWMPKERAKRLMRKSGIWEKPSKNIALSQ